MAGECAPGTRQPAVRGRPRLLTSQEVPF